MKRLIVAFAVLALLLTSACGSDSTGQMTISKIQSMSYDELNSTFEKAACCTTGVPDGKYSGKLIIWPDFFMSGFRTFFMDMAWRGKLFQREQNPNKGEVINRLLLYNDYSADVFIGKSIHDGKDAIIEDYSNRSWLMSSFRGELRPVGDGIFLGKLFWMPKTGTVQTKVQWIWFVIKPA